MFYSTNKKINKRYYILDRVPSFPPESGFLATNSRDSQDMYIYFFKNSPATCAVAVILLRRRAEFLHRVTSSAIWVRRPAPNCNPVAANRKGQKNKIVKWLQHLLKAVFLKVSFSSLRMQPHSRAK